MSRPPRASGAHVDASNVGIPGRGWKPTAGRARPAPASRASPGRRTARSAPPSRQEARMRRPVALVVLTLAFCACRGEPPGPQSAGSQRAREQALQQNEQARRLAQTQQNDAGEVAGNTTDAPEGPGYLTPGPAPSQIPPTTRPGAAGAALPKGEGSA